MSYQIATRKSVRHNVEFWYGILICLDTRETVRYAEAMSEAGVHNILIGERRRLTSIENTEWSLHEPARLRKVGESNRPRQLHKSAGAVVARADSSHGSLFRGCGH